MEQEVFANVMLFDELFADGFAWIAVLDDLIRGQEFVTECFVGTAEQ